LVVAGAVEGGIPVLAVDVEGSEVHQDEVATAGGVEGVDLVEDAADVVVDGGAFGFLVIDEGVVSEVVGAIPWVWLVYVIVEDMYVNIQIA